MEVDADFVCQFDLAQQRLDRGGEQVRVRVRARLRRLVLDRPRQVREVAGGLHAPQHGRVALQQVDHPGQGVGGGVLAGQQHGQHVARHLRVAEAAERLQPEGRAFINGAYVAAVSGATFDCVSPIDGSVIAQIAACDSADVDIAVAGARAAFNSGEWSNASPARRKKVLQRFAALILENADELALLETIDMGKPISDSRLIDVPGSAKCINFYAEAVDKISDEIAPTDPSAVAMVVREPLGVIGAVVPWNFPLMMASWKLGPALATGNSVVLKPAEQSTKPYISFVLFRTC